MDVSKDSISVAILHSDRDAAVTDKISSDAESVCAGFTVAIDDVVAGPFLRDYRTMIRNRPYHVIVLLPSIEVIARREADRKAKGYWAWTAEQFYEGFVNTTPHVGIWLDTSDLTPQETVEAILAQTADHSRSSRSPLEVVDYD
jgi:hypothetical protein